MFIFKRGFQLTGASPVVPDPRAGLNESEAPDKVVIASSPKPFNEIALRSTYPHFNFAEALVKNVKTDTFWQPTLQRQLGVTMYCSTIVFIA